VTVLITIRIFVIYCLHTMKVRWFQTRSCCAKACCLA